MSSDGIHSIIQNDPSMRASKKPRIDNEQNQDVTHPVHQNNLVEHTRSHLLQVSQGHLNKSYYVRGSLENTNVLTFNLPFESYINAVSITRIHFEPPFTNPNNFQYVPYYVWTMDQTRANLNIITGVNDSFTLDFYDTSNNFIVSATVTINPGIISKTAWCTECNNQLNTIVQGTAFFGGAYNGTWFAVDGNDIEITIPSGGTPHKIRLPGTPNNLSWYFMFGDMVPDDSYITENPTGHPLGAIAHPFEAQLVETRMASEAECLRAAKWYVSLLDEGQYILEEINNRYAIFNDNGEDFYVSAFNSFAVSLLGVASPTINTLASARTANASTNNGINNPYWYFKVTTISFPPLAIVVESPRLTSGMAMNQIVDLAGTRKNVLTVLPWVGNTDLEGWRKTHTVYVSDTERYHCYINHNHVIDFAFYDDVGEPFTGPNYVIVELKYY